MSLLVPLILLVAACAAAPQKSYRNGPDLVPSYGALAKSVFGRPDTSTGEKVAKYDPKTSQMNPEELGSYAAGDILVTKQAGRNGLVAASARWPRGRIPFVINANFGEIFIDFYNSFLKISMCHSY
jgi:hypothetical protein